MKSSGQCRTGLVIPSYDLKEKLKYLHQNLTNTVLGAEEASYFLIVALLSNGHVLIQGAPGVGKTALAQALADSIDGSFNRVQFTPDLLPSDILGYSMYNQGSGKFNFIPGPVFSNILLADEINRTSPRIQSALLECMNEHQVTVDGMTRKLDSPFLVVATQNNLYASGTFPLPEPQLDRFLISVLMRMPERAVQTEILKLHANRDPGENVQAVLSAGDISTMQEQVLSVQVSENVCSYISGICEEARKRGDHWAGLSSRASIALMRAAQAAAFIDDAPAVYPDHVKRVAAPVLLHRLSGSGQGGTDTVLTQIDDLLKATPVP